MIDADTVRYGILLVTAASRAEAEVIARTLVTAKLAACVSLYPVFSISCWQGDLCQVEEWQLLIKTDLSQFKRIEATVQELHSYEVPEIVALPFVEGSGAYLAWIGENVE